MTKVAPAIVIPHPRLPAEESARTELLNRYFCELFATARETKNGWRLSLRRPPTLDFYVDPKLNAGLHWWRQTVGPISIVNIANVVAHCRGYVLSMSDAWTLHSWSEWLMHQPPSDNQVVTILHVDDHRDFMSPRLRFSGKSFADMLTNKSVDMKNSETVSAAIRSGAIGMGSFFAPFLHTINAADIRHLSAREAILTSEMKSIHLGRVPDTLLEPTADRLSMIISNNTTSHCHLQYKCTNLHRDWLHGIKEGPILLHIDMDYFSNRYDCDSDRLVKCLWYDPSPKQITEAIDDLFAALEINGLTRRIVHCHIALSPGFFAGDLWELGISRIEMHIHRLCADDAWGALNSKNHSRASRGITRTANRDDSPGAPSKSPQTVQLVRGKGSKSRGGGPGGLYWHILVEGKRIGCVFINIVSSGARERASLQIFLSVKARGKGYGRQAYRMACEQSGLKEIHIEMRKSNVASRRAAAAAGFEIEPCTFGNQLAMVWRRSRSI